MAKARRKSIAVQPDMRALLPDAFDAIDNPAPVVVEEYRALEMLDVVPAGCVAFRDTMGMCNPHVKPGDFAVADTSDRDLRVGEIYLVRWSNGDCNILQLRKSKCANEGIWWWLGPMKTSLVRATSDGPYSGDCEDHLRSKIVGRVFGVLIPARGRA